MEDTLLAIEYEFGRASLFWKTLSKVPEVLQPFWRGFHDVLNVGLIPKKTKMMITYETALADGCPKCRAGFRQLLEIIGVDSVTIEQLERDIRTTNLDEETKNILIFAHHASKNPHQVDEGFVAAFKGLIGEAKLVETVMVLGGCKAIIDAAHCLNLHAVEVER